MSLLQPFHVQPPSSYDLAEDEEGSLSLPQFFYGHDFGNSTVTGVAYADDGKRFGSLTFPSLSAPGSSRQLESIRSAADLPVFGEGDYLLQFEGRESYIGTLAFESSDASAARGDVTRYWSKRSLEALLVASAKTIPYPSYELFVVTGLPIETFSKEHRRMVRDALSGDYTFLLNGKARRAVIHVSQVVMEGAGALIVHGEQKKQSRQGAIDIGGRTTDLFATRGQVPRVELCKGKALGVEKIGEYLQEQVQEHLSGYTLAAEDIYGILRASVGAGQMPDVWAHGEQVSPQLLRTWLGRARQAAGRDIASFVSSVWRGNEQGNIAANFQVAVLVGGGAYYFHQEIMHLIPHVTIPPEPELANALGYGKLAVALGPERAVRIAG